MISPADRQFLLEIARKTLSEYLAYGTMPDLQTEHPALLEARAVFVTLRDRISGELRGCRGETQARQPLIEAVARMTIASALDDPRFPPVYVEELPQLHIEINALTPLAPILPEEITIGQHGLMIVKGYYAGLLLPEVAVRYGWDVETFLRAVCHKAGLPESAWTAKTAKLFGFETEVWEEA